MSEADRRGRKTATDAARRASRRSKLGPDPRCDQCGVADPALLMLEEHHVAGRANDAALTVTNCRNCHAENTERLRVGGVSMEPPADEFERAVAIIGGVGQLQIDVGNRLVGCAELLKALMQAAEEDCPEWQRVVKSLPSVRDLMKEQ